MRGHDGGGLDGGVADISTTLGEGVSGQHSTGGKVSGIHAQLLGFGFRFFAHHASMFFYGVYGG